MALRYFKIPEQWCLLENCSDDGLNNPYYQYNSDHWTQIHGAEFGKVSTQWAQYRLGCLNHDDLQRIIPAYGKPCKDGTDKNRYQKKDQNRID
jgi:hypothetical protein